MDSLLHQLIRKNETGGANGLLNALIAYWPGNEASGNALDLHTNALHLTDANTVTNNTGLVYATARQYTAATFEYHATAGDDALLSTGDVDFTLAAWCYFDTAPGVDHGRSIASKYNINGNQREYLLIWENLAGVSSLKFVVSPNGITTTVLTGGLPVISTWYFLVAWHDSVANTINLQVDDGAVASVAHATGVFDSTARFTLGAIWNGAAPIANYYQNGRIGPTMFWKSAAGGGGVLSAAQRTALYNAGAGLPYTSFTV